MKNPKILKFAAKIFLSIAIIASCGLLKTANAAVAAETVKIPIAYASDNNYVLPTTVSMQSLFDNAAPGTFYDVYILVSGDMTAENRAKLTNMRRANTSVTLVDMGDEFAGSREGWAKTATYYRLKLPSVFSNFNKFIYLDSDTIIFQDLTEMYNVNIENYWVAGVSDGCFADRARIKSSEKFEKYVNAGVLLLNLKQMRENLVEKMFFDLILEDREKNFLPFYDQDAINEICHGKIQILPFKYNTMYAYLNIYLCDGMTSNDLKFYKKDELDEAAKLPVIVHYTFGKPWNSILRGRKGQEFQKEWWKYAKRTPYFKEIVDIYVNPMRRRMRARMMRLIGCA
jgi:lipopolysaccharide biosynthesis glycosyltransferase